VELIAAVARITFVQPDGSRQTVEAQEGRTVMEAAKHHNVRGIRAACGGELQCCTCHCYVEQGWDAKLPPKHEAEAAMLEWAHEPRAASRLSCQLLVTPCLDGLIVHVPERQL
jgi:ferredoxin, 2Fe-2S